MRGSPFIAAVKSANVLGAATGTSLALSGAITLGTDLILRRSAAATLSLGDTAAAAPIAQTIGVQNVLAGTSNTAGVALTFKGSASTGSANGGSIIFQVTPAGGAGSSQNAFATALTIDSAKVATFAANIACTYIRATKSALDGGSNNGVTVTSDAYVNFSSTTGITGAVDLIVSRSSVAGVLRVSGNTAGSTGAAVRLVGYAFASLPAASAGTIAYVTDSNTATWGATIAGGGANGIMAFYNGTNWTVFAA